MFGTIAAESQRLINETHSAFVTPSTPTLARPEVDVLEGLTTANQAVMAHADWIIDLGPGAGHDGGRTVFEGTPADLVAARFTLTGEHLAAYVGT